MEATERTKKVKVEQIRNGGGEPVTTVECVPSLLWPIINFKAVLRLVLYKPFLILPHVLLYLKKAFLL